MAAPQLAQRPTPASMVGPLVTRGGVTRGARARNKACIRSNVEGSMMAGTATSIHSARERFFFVLLSVWLK
jgi:hypothetical protein